MLKRLVTVICISLVVFTGCKKDSKIEINSEIKKNIETGYSRGSEFILTSKDKEEIEKEFKGFKFKNDLNDSISKYGLASKAELINQLNLIKSKFEDYFTQKNITISALEAVGNNAPPDTTTLPTVTVTCENINSGGMFSSFTLRFSYNGITGISNQSLLLTGGTIGWWWNSGYSTTTGLNSGYIKGTATYFYGLGTFSLPYTLNFTYNPGALTLTYHWNSGLTPTQNN